MGMSSLGGVGWHESRLTGMHVEMQMTKKAVDGYNQVMVPEVYHSRRNTLLCCA